MKKEIYKDRALLQLFKQNEEIPFSDMLNKQIMLKVYKIQKRKTIHNLFIVGAISLTLLTGVIYTLKHYLKFDFSILFQGLMKKPENFSFPDFSSIFFSSLIVCSLLWIDYRIRKKWLHL